MAELETKKEVETGTEDFSDDLSDEALDRDGTGAHYSNDLTSICLDTARSPFID